MNINIASIAKSAEKGLTTAEYIYLLVMQDQCNYLFQSSYFNNVYIPLVDKKLIKENQGEFVLTETGKKLLAEIEGIKEMSKKVENLIDLRGLKETLQNCLLKNYGKKQTKGFANTYFMPSDIELQDSFKRFWKHFPDMKDMVKITKILENHIKICSKKNSFSPAIRYYIIKMGDSGINSPLSAAYDNYEEEIIETKQTVEPKDIKNLF